MLRFFLERTVGDLGHRELFDPVNDPCRIRSAGDHEVLVWLRFYRSHSRCYGARWLVRKPQRDILSPPGLALVALLGLFQ